MNIIAPVFAPQFRAPVPADLQDIIREKMMEQAMKLPRQSESRNAARQVDRGRERRKELMPEATRLFEQGMPINKIAVQIGCARNTLIRILKDAGVDLVLDGKQRAAEKARQAVADEAFRLLLQGQSQTVVAKKVGIARSTLSRMIEESGVDLGSTKDRMSRAKQKPISTPDGLTFPSNIACAEYYGVTVDTVRRRIMPGRLLRVEGLHPAAKSDGEAAA